LLYVGNGPLAASTNEKRAAVDDQQRDGQCREQHGDQHRWRRLESGDPKSPRLSDGEIGRHDHAPLQGDAATVVPTPCPGRSRPWQTATQLEASASGFVHPEFIARLAMYVMTANRRHALPRRTKMNKLIAALGFSTALTLSPALAQTAAPAPDAPMAAPMMHHHHHHHHHHHKAMMKPLADAPKT